MTLSSVASNLGPWCSTAALWLWVGTSSVWLLPLSAVFLVLSLSSGTRPDSRWRGAGLSVLIIGILVGFAAERQIGAVSDDWDSYWNQRVDEVGVLLRGELEERRHSAGTEVVQELVRLWDSDAVTVDGDAIANLRARSRSSALALYDRDGELIAWDGIHRGRVPEAVKRGERLDLYRDLPLFGYLYVTASAPDGSVAVASYLLRASLPEGLGADMGDLASRFFAETGERIRITEEDPGVAEAVWDLALDEDRLLSVVLDEPDAADRLDVLETRWVLRVAVLCLLAWLMLAIGGPLAGGEAVAASVVMLVAAATLPTGFAGPFEAAFESDLHGLPGLMGMSAGRLALVIVFAFLLVAVLSRRRPSLPFWAVGLVVLVLFPLTLLWLAGGLAPELLSGGRPEWVVSQIAAAGLLTLIAGVGLTYGRDGGGGRGWVLTGLGCAVVILGASWAWVGYRILLPVAFPAVWALPVAMVARGLHAWPGWQRAVVAWSSATVLGSFAAIPMLWGQGIEAQLQAGEDRLVRLAAVEDVEVENRLFDFARIADSLDAVGSEDVTILYEGWRVSGLAALGQPVRLQIEERDGSPGEGLRVGVEPGTPPVSEFYSDVCPKSRWVLLLIPWYPWLILQEEIYLCMLMSGLHLFSNS